MVKPSMEKLLQAFYAHMISIYWGDSAVGMVYNKKTFINIHAYEGLDAVLEGIKELDGDRKNVSEYCKSLYEFLTIHFGIKWKILERFFIILSNS